MAWMKHMPRGAKLKLTWLATAFAVVWISAPGGAHQVLHGAESAVAAAPAVVAASPGVVAAAPAVIAAAPGVVAAAAASSSPGSGAAGAGRGGVPAAAGQGAWLEVPVARGGVAEERGVRLGVLAVADTPAPYVAGAGDGARLVYIYVALKNVGGGRVTYTALDLDLRDEEGRYESVEARRGPGPMLGFGTLAPGEAAAGWRVFRVPAGAGPLFLTFDL